MRPDRLIGILLVLITLALYWPVTHFDFVDYDDPLYVSENPHVQQGLSAESLVWAVSSSHVGNWDPIDWSSHMFVWQFFGGNAGAHHMANVTLHAINALLLFLFLNRTTKQLWLSALAAALFAWHPMQVEAVAWISERKGVLSSFFWLLTLLAYAYYTERPSIKRFALVLSSFTLGLMTKPMLVTLPFALLLLDIWPLHRSYWLIKDNVQAPSQPRMPFRNLISEKWPLFALTAIWMGIAYATQKQYGAVSDFDRVELGPRLANAAVSYARYIAHTFWPVDLCFFYPQPIWSTGVVIGAAMFLVLASLLIYKFKKDRPYLAVGWCWFLGIFVPVIQIVQIGEHSMADRYFYLPGIGIFVILIWGLADLIHAYSGKETHIRYWLLPILIACIMETRTQINTWQNSRTLFEHALKATPDNYVAYNNLGHLLAQEGRVDEAITQYREALRIKPALVEAQNNLASALLAKGDAPEAINLLKQAIEKHPGNAQSHYNLGLALSSIGKLTEAAAEYQSALQLRSDYAQAHNNLAAILLRNGDLNGAISHYEAAIQANPNLAVAHYNLAAALLKAGRTEEAKAHFEEAIRLNPALQK